jgi:hypothetical protein
MTNATFNKNGQTWRIREIMETNSVIRDLGWTHFAMVTRLNGKKAYYANLQINEGAIIASMVVC